MCAPSPPRGWAGTETCETRVKASLAPTCGPLRAVPHPQRGQCPSLFQSPSSRKQRGGSTVRCRQVPQGQQGKELLSPSLTLGSPLASYTQPFPILGRSPARAAAEQAAFPSLLKLPLFSAQAAFGSEPGLKCDGCVNRVCQDPGSRGLPMSPRPLPALLHFILLQHQFNTRAGVCSLRLCSFEVLWDGEMLMFNFCRRENVLTTTKEPGIIW